MRSRHFRFACGLVALLAVVATILRSSRFDPPFVDPTAPREFGSTDEVRSTSDGPDLTTTLEASDRSWLRTVAAADVEGSNDLAPVEFEGSIRGMVRWRSGGVEGVRAARVRCSPSMGRAVDAHPDGAGSFQIRGLPLGPVTIQCTLAGAEARAQEIWLGDGAVTADVVIELRRVRTIQVFVLDGSGRRLTSESLTPPALEELTLHVASTMPQVGGLVSESAKADLPTFEPRWTGTTAATDPEVWRTLVTYEGDVQYACLALDDFVLDAQRIPEGVDRIYLRAAPFVLGDRLGALDVFVEADDRALVSRAFVRVVRVPRSSHTRTGRTDESGHVQWIGISPGKYQVDVTRDGLVARRALVDVPPGRPPAVVRLRMDPGMTITGRVSGIRLPTHGTRVLCRPLDHASGLAGDADELDPSESSEMARPTFEFPSLPAGRYELRAESLDGTATFRRVEVDVRSGSVRDVVLVPD